VNVIQNQARYWSTDHARNTIAGAEQRHGLTQVTLTKPVCQIKYDPRNGLVGGLFLAFPAIFPAGATLIEKHEQRRSRAVGTLRARRSVALDAAGAGLGAFGLLTLGFLVWKLFPALSANASLLIAAAGWFAISLLAWKLWLSWLRRRLFRWARRAHSSGQAQ